jgi:molybdate transport system substrate-binding protein
LRFPRAAAIAVAVAVPALAACGGAGSAAPGPAATVAGTVTVLAAASLTDAFNAEGHAFEKQYPATHVEFSYGGSSALAAQIEQGAPADVFASADQASMDRVADQVAGTQRVFASNRLQIAVAPGNPKRITGLSDLARPDLVVVLCAPQVPCGAYSQQALKRAGAGVSARSQEADVRSVLTKVATGEADAGIVYATDVRSSGGKVDGVDIPDSLNVPATYPAAVLKDGSNRHAAAAFVDFLVSGDGQAILARYGFQKP